MKRPSFESLAVGYLVAAAIGIGLSTTGCEKNITEVIVDEAAKVDTVTIKIPVPGDTLWTGILMVTVSSWSLNTFGRS